MQPHQTGLLQSELLPQYTTLMLNPPIMQAFDSTSGSWSVPDVDWTSFLFRGLCLPTIQATKPLSAGKLKVYVIFMPLVRGLAWSKETDWNLYQQFYNPTWEVQAEWRLQCIYLFLLWMPVRYTDLGAYL